VIGAARSELSTGDYRTMVRDAIVEAIPDGKRDGAMLDDFLERIDYVAVDATGTSGWNELAGMVRNDVTRVFYFSVAPGLFGDLADRLNEHRIATRHCRIVVEKPFGRDLASARDLNATLARHFSEEQIYRIDHYLGKETVQNLMAVRFANVLFEPLWNAQYVDHVQITVAETVGVGGRGAYYDKSGADAGHGAEPPDAASLPHCDGAPQPVRSRRGARRKAQGDPRPRSGRPQGHRARPVHRQRHQPRLSRRGREPRQPDRKLPSRCGSGSRTGGGRARRSTCAPASG
jgi:hypothetical protein